MKPGGPRQKVVLPATMRAGAGQAEVCIRDASSRGMLLQAATPPVRGSYVEILRPTCTIVGPVVWTKDRRFGIQTRDRIMLSAVIERRTVPRAGDAGHAPLVQGRAQAPSPRPAGRAEPAVG